jgi:DNA-binding transcriptional MerR regulator
MLRGFTRQETILLTGIKSSQLSYFDRTDLITPQKIGNPTHPKVIYTWQQVLELKTIERLRVKLSLQEIRKVLDFLRIREHKPSFFSHQMVFVNSQLYLIENANDFGLTVLEASGANKGQVVIREIGAVGDVISELWKEAQKHQVLDFDRRAGDIPLEFQHNFVY